MKTAVVTFPGSNCDRDMWVALRDVSGKEPVKVWHGDADLPDGLDFIALPGGFSYGDYLRSGSMAANSPIMRSVVAAAERGVPVAGGLPSEPPREQLPPMVSPRRPAAFSWHFWR